MWYKAENRKGNGMLQNGRAEQICQQLGISDRRLRQIIADYKRFHDINAPLVPHTSNQTGGRVGKRLALTDVRRQKMLSVAQQYLDNGIYCTDRLLREGMIKRGENFALSTIQKWKKIMEKENLPLSTAG